MEQEQTGGERVDKTEEPSAGGDTTDDNSANKPQTLETGLGATMKYVQENQSQIKKETPDIPNNMSNVPLSKLCDTSRKNIPGISIYYCNICGLDLNSKVTFDAHIAGSKHRKKEKNLASIDCVLAMQQKLELENIQEIQVKVEAGSKQTRKEKELSAGTIRDRVSNSTEPIVGLKYIVEVFPESARRGEYEPWYECELCCTDTSCSSMYFHILGAKHREKYLAMKYNLYNLERRELKVECQRIEELEGKNVEDIQTVFSDQRFNWPGGKRPATAISNTNESAKRSREEERAPAEATTSVNKPEFARRGYDFSRHQEDQRNKPSLKNSHVAKILTSLRQCVVKNEEDADMAHQVAAHLVRALSEYKDFTGSMAETKYLREDCEVVLERMLRIKEIKSGAAAVYGEPPRPEREEAGQASAWQGGVVDYGHGRVGAAAGGGGGGGGAGPAPPPPLERAPAPPGLGNVSWGPSGRRDIPDSSYDYPGGGGGGGGGGPSWQDRPGFPPPEDNLRYGRDGDYGNRRDWRESERDRGYYSSR